MDLKFIKHHSKLEGCHSIWIMENTGLYHARIYMYDDDLSTVYMDNLSVNNDSRHKGIGTELLKVGENMAKENGYNCVKIWVEKGTWIRAWYKRMGYVYDQPNKEQNAVWLKKLI